MKNVRMRECNKCGNFIPQDAENTCPHCSNRSVGLRRFIFGVTLFAVCGLIIFFIWRAQGGGIGGKIVFTVLAIPLPALFGLLSVFEGRSELSRRVQQYRVHAPHDFTDSCYCKVCGKLNAHTWNGCTCTVCGKTRDEGHDLEKRVCPRCDGEGKYREDKYGALSYGDPDYGGAPDYGNPDYKGTWTECEHCKGKGGWKECSKCGKILAQ